MNVTTATEREVVAALSLLFQFEANSQAAVAAASKTFSSGEWTLDDLLVAKSGDSVIGAILAKPLAGSTGLLLPPQAIHGRVDVEDALTTAAISRLSSCKVVQSFVDPGATQASQSLLRVGFQRITHLHQMHRPATAILHSVDSGRIRFVRYADVDPMLFFDVFARCLEDSLDCPELHSVLTVEQAVAGYRECAPDMDAWWLATSDDRPVGTLVMNANTISFIGVVPEHRGRGIGRAIIAFACKNSPELSLVVDSRNAPAVQLYRRFDFEAVSTREVYLKSQKV